jgi:hypothetical protein
VEGKRRKKRRGGGPTAIISGMDMCSFTVECISRKKKISFLYMSPPIANIRPDSVALAYLCTRADVHAHAHADAAATPKLNLTSFQHIPF